MGRRDVRLVILEDAGTVNCRRGRHAHVRRIRALRPCRATLDVEPLREQDYKPRLGFCNSPWSHSLDAALLPAPIL